jgi:cyclic pyranopterin phosphate synthase
MPQNPVWLDHAEILTFEEIARVASVLAPMGVEKIRLSGGEPLVRKDLERLVGMLARVRGIKSVAMTTNGALLKEKVRVLKDNGLTSVTVSLHSLIAKRFERITGKNNIFERVLEGIEEAKKVGLRLKINCVITRGCNEDEIVDFAKLAHDSNVTVRFIEYMPFDGTKLWDSELVVSGREIIEKISSSYGLVPLERQSGATATTYMFADGSRGEIGTITSMTSPFCGDCDRIRLKADGKLVPCLFSLQETDLKPLLRHAATDVELEQFIRRSFWQKFEGVESLIKRKTPLAHVRPMHTIGG